MVVETVFQYRTLIGMCDLGCGLEWDDIDHMTEIEHSFRSRVGDGRRFRRQAVELSGILRGVQINDRVQVIEIGLGGAVCTRAPFIAHGEQVELVFDDGDFSYRFRAQGVWLRDEGDDYRVGLQLIGMPVRLHKVQISAHIDDVVDKIGVAA
jgi:hypothetical protein